MKRKPSNPYSLKHTVLETEIDHLNHVNNKVYLEWMEHIAWQHSLSVGIDEALIKTLGKVMVIGRHEMNFHSACYLGDRLQIDTWVTAPSSAKKRTRFYQITREKDGKRVFTAQTLWICMDIKTHKSTAMPNEFIEPYQGQYETINPSKSLRYL